MLKPGGRFAVSDIVTRGEVPEQIRKEVLLWAGRAGTLQDTEYAQQARQCWLRGHRHRAHARLYRRGRGNSLSGKGVNVDEMAPYIDGKFMSASSEPRSLAPAPIPRPAAAMPERWT